jgi:hypothetical protein
MLVQVRIAAGESLVSVASLMRKEDGGKHVLTIVLQLAHDDEQEDLRMTAVRSQLHLVAQHVADLKVIQQAACIYVQQLSRSFSRYCVCRLCF